MKEFIKKRVSFLFKYIVGFVLLFWILARVDRAEMIDAISNIHFLVLISLFGLAVVNLGVQFFRWKYLVESHSDHYNKRDLLPSFFAGFAFRMLIPGGHAEITKVFLLPGKKRGKVVAFGIEKYFQTYIKLILVLITIPLVFPEYRLVLWLMAGIIICSYFFLPLIFKHSLMKKMQEKTVNYHKIFIFTLLYSIAIFILLIYQYYVLLNDFNAIDFLDTSISVIFIWGSGLIPISISGLGVRENLAAFFLAKYGVPPYAAVGASLFIFFINAIVPALIGLYFIIKRRKDLRDAEGTIKSITKTIYQAGKQKLNGKRSSAQKPAEE
ncbi:MAG: lysylphosphatidylglycerol synthase transmembrane domain-containing protein [Calditrichaceae bacterium]